MAIKHKITVTSSPNSLSLSLNFTFFVGLSLRWRSLIDVGQGLEVSYRLVLLIIDWRVSDLGFSWTFLVTKHNVRTQAQINFQPMIWRNSYFPSSLYKNLQEQMEISRALSLWDDWRYWTILNSNRRPTRGLVFGVARIQICMAKEEEKEKP